MVSKCDFDIGEGFFYEAKESLVVEQKLQQVLIDDYGC